MPFILLFYAFVLLVFAAIAVVVFRFLRRWGRIWASVGTLLVMFSAVLLWPIPIHGGIMFLGGALYDEWIRDRADRLEEELRVVKSKQQTTKRFAGILDITSSTRIGDGWLEVEYIHGNRAVLHEASGLIWSHWLPLSTDELRPTLVLAKELCATREPVGYWTLATSAEDALAWRDNGNSVIPRPNTSTMSYILDQHFGMEFPTYQLQARHAINQQAVRSGLFSIRCVARGANAPANGYTQADIDLELWNSYQIEGLIAP